LKKEMTESAGLSKHARARRIPAPATAFAAPPRTEDQQSREKIHHAWPHVQIERPRHNHNHRCSRAAHFPQALLDAAAATRALLRPVWSRQCRHRRRQRCVGVVVAIAVASVQSWRRRRDQGSASLQMLRPAIQRTCDKRSSNGNGC